MPDDALRLQVQADVTDLKAKMIEASGSVESASARMASALAAQGLSAKEIASGLESVGLSAKGLVPVSEAAASGMNNFRSAMGQARVEMGALEGSTGMMAGGLARIAAQSEALAPIIQNLFPAFVAIAFVDILAATYSKIVDVTSAFEGWDAAAKSAYEDSLKANQQQLEWVTKLKIEQRELNEIGLTGSAKTRVAVKDDIAAAKDYADLLKTQQGILREIQAQRDGASKAVDIIDPETGERLGQAMNQQVGGVREGSKAWDELTKKMSEAQRAIDETAHKIEELEKVAVPKEVAAGAADVLKEQQKRGKELETIYDGVREHASKMLDTIIKGTQERVHMEDEEATLFMASQDREVRVAAEALDKQIEARQKFSETAIKLDEEQAARSVDAQSQQVALKLKLQELAIESSGAPAIGKVRAAADAQISELEQLRSFEEQKLQIEIDARQKELALLKGGKSDVEFATTASPEQLAQYQQIQGQIEAAKQQSAAKIQQINGQIVVTEQQATNQIRQYWEGAFSGVNRPFETAINGILRGTETASLAFRKMGSEILLSVVNTTIQAGLRWTEHFLVTEALEKSATANRLATLASGEAAKRALMATSNTLEITGDSAKGGAAAFASVLEALPFPANVAAAPGIAASQVAAIEAFAAAGSFEHGGIVPINAHAGEMVLPRDLSEGVQNAIRGGGLKGGSGGGDTHNHFTFNGGIHTRDAGDFSKQIKQMIRRGEFRL